MYWHVYCDPGSLTFGMFIQMPASSLQMLGVKVELEVYVYQLTTNRFVIAVLVRATISVLVTLAENGKVGLVDDM